MRQVWEIIEAITDINCEHNKLIEEIKDRDNLIEELQDKLVTQEARENNKILELLKSINTLEDSNEELEDRVKLIESNAEFEQSASIVREKNLYMLINTLEERNQVLEELVLRNEESEARRVM